MEQDDGKNSSSWGATYIMTVACVHTTIIDKSGRIIATCGEDKLDSIYYKL